MVSTTLACPAVPTPARKYAATTDANLSPSTSHASSPVINDRILDDPHLRHFKDLLAKRAKLSKQVHINLRALRALRSRKIIAKKAMVVSVGKGSINQGQSLTSTCLTDASSHSQAVESTIPPPVPQRSYSKSIDFHICSSPVSMEEGEHEPMRQCKEQAGVVVAKEAVIYRA